MQLNVAISQIKLNRGISQIKLNRGKMNRGRANLGYDKPIPPSRPYFLWSKQNHYEDYMMAQWPLHCRYILTC